MRQRYSETSTLQELLFANFPSSKSVQQAVVGRLPDATLQALLSHRFAFACLPWSPPQRAFDAGAQTPTPGVVDLGYMLHFTSDSIEANNNMYILSLGLTLIMTRFPHWSEYGTGGHTPHRSLLCGCNDNDV